MPPKQPVKVGGKQNAAAAENDLTDVTTLPILNDFVFTTLYAFKYRNSQIKIEEALKLELDLSLQPPSNDPEILDAQKRNKVIQIRDLIEIAEARGYMTSQEIIENKDPNKV